MNEEDQTKEEAQNSFSAAFAKANAEKAERLAAEEGKSTGRKLKDVINSVAPKRRQVIFPEQLPTYTTGVRG